VHREHAAGIQARVHLHEGDTGRGVAGQDRPLDGRRAAPARQQRGVDIQAPEARQLQYRIRQDLAIGHDDHDIRCQHREVRARGRIAQGGRLRHPQTVPLRDLLDGTGSQQAAAALRPVRLGEDADDGMP
jgi:hypothetical protein